MGRGGGGGGEEEGGGRKRGEEVLCPLQATHIVGKERQKVNLIQSNCRCHAEDVSGYLV